LATPAQRRNAAFYAAPVEAFLAASDEEAYAPLAAPHGYTLAPEQLSAWRLQLPVLRDAGAGVLAERAETRPDDRLVGRLPPVSWERCSHHSFRRAK